MDHNLALSGLEQLYERAIAHYRAFEAESFVVSGSIPILYFGNLAAYRASRIKIVTVGLNPSDAEFSVDRFGLAQMDVVTPATLARSLSAYFEANPYYQWFDPAFETLLQPLGASFYEAHPRGRQRAWWAEQSNRALHTDLGTPLATSPTWSGLTPDQRERLRAIGFPLWRDLIRQLDPDLILVSVAWRHLRELGDLDWREFSPFPGAESRRQLKISNLGSAKIVWGTAQVRPFFHLSRCQRPLAADAILRESGLA